MPVLQFTLEIASEIHCIKLYDCTKTGIPEGWNKAGAQPKNLGGSNRQEGSKYFLRGEWEVGKVWFPKVTQAHNNFLGQYGKINKRPSKRGSRVASHLFVYLCHLTYKNKCCCRFLYEAICHVLSQQCWFFRVYSVKKHTSDNYQT